LKYQLKLYTELKDMTKGSLAALYSIIHFNKVTKLISIFCKDYSDELLLAEPDCLSQIQSYKDVLKSTPYDILSFKSSKIEVEVDQAQQILQQIDIYCFEKNYENNLEKPKGCYAPKPDPRANEGENSGMFMNEQAEDQNMVLEEGKHKNPQFPEEDSSSDGGKVEDDSSSDGEGETSRGEVKEGEKVEEEPLSSEEKNEK
jgi:hypothetical protein